MTGHASKKETDVACDAADGKWKIGTTVLADVKSVFLELFEFSIFKFEFFTGSTVAITR